MTYQFKIQLIGYSNPDVWRRIIIPANRSFYQFQQVISTVFDQKKIHAIYSFTRQEEASELVIVSNDFFFKNSIYSRKIFLSDVFKKPGDFIMYNFEMYDWLLHRIELESTRNKVIPNAVCLDGEGAFPPYACYGADDYNEMKQALSDKNHPKHHSTLEWLELDENETWEDKYRFDRSKVNEALKLIDIDPRSFRTYQVTPLKTVRKQYGMTTTLMTELNKIYYQIAMNEDNNREVQQLEALSKKYPKIPYFKNSLCFLKYAEDDNERYYQRMIQIMDEFPDFVTALCELVYNYSGEEKRLEVRKLLGEKFDLCELYPEHRGRFTEDDIFKYHCAVFKQCLSSQNMLEAQLHLNYLEYLNPSMFDELDLQTLFYRTINYKEGDEPLDQWVVQVIPEKVTPALKKPKYVHSDIRLLYKYDAEIDRDILHRIMKLPRETVIKDLESVLIDSIARFDYYKKKGYSEEIFAPIHALFLLSSLQAEEALDTLFTVIRQDEAYFNFWFDDVLTEFIGHIIYGIGKNQLNRLKDFALEPNRYTFVRTGIADALMKVAYFHKERKEEVLNLLEEMIQFMLDHKDEVNSDVFENEVYFLWLESLIHISDKEQLPLCLRLYDEQLIECTERLSLQELKIKLVEPMPFYITERVYETIDQYYDEWLSWNDDDFEDLDYEEAFDELLEPFFSDRNELPETFIAEKTAGRNDLCPCGSGKKYKKCCGANG